MTVSPAALTAPVQPVFSKICRIPDLLAEGGEPILSLYADDDQVLHIQCRLQTSGHLVLFPVTFRLVNRYLNGDYTLAQLIECAPCTTLMLVTRAHNLLELDKDDFDVSRLSFAGMRYNEILSHKSASLEEIRSGLHACLRS